MIIRPLLLAVCGFPSHYQNAELPQTCQKKAGLRYRVRFSSETICNATN